MKHAKLLLNKMIEDGTTSALGRYNIDKEDMHSDVDKHAYDVISEYAATNNGKAPSYATVASSVPGFEYIPEVSDSYVWLASKIKDATAQQEVVDWFRNGKEFQRKLTELGGTAFINEWLPSQISDIQSKTNIRQSVGTDVKRDTEKFMDEYARRKAGESFRVWKSRYSAIGEYVSSNLYTIYGKSGRGKSVIALSEGVYAAQQGANVIIWSMEMGWFEVMVRLYVMMSGDEGVSTATIKGIDMEAGFDSNAVRLGRLPEGFEEAFESFIDTLNDSLKGTIVVRSVDDEDFSDRSLRALRADIEEVEADFVIIDPFYYMDYETNTSKTAGGDASNTSNKLRRLTGVKGVVTIAITQADETDVVEDDDGERELDLPKRKDVKKTKALLEDAALLIGVDSAYKQGRGIVGVFKGRDGGEGNVSDILYLPQVGVVREAEVGDAVMDDFEF